MKRTVGARRHLLPAVALCALALTACGTTQADGAGSSARPGPAKSVDAAAAPKAKSTPEPQEAEQSLAYMRFLNKVAAPCFPDLPQEPPLDDQGAEEGEGAEGTDFPPEPSLSDAPLPSEPPLPSRPPSDSELNRGSHQWSEKDKKEEAKLEAGHKCATKAHIDRVTKAVKGLKDPAAVSGALTRSGYTGPFVKTRTAPNGGTSFSVDLRMWGSTECLAGTATGAVPSVRQRDVLDPEAPCPLS
ncbi:hypothetical protein ACIP93_37370 [Streptomyces sp. NPDC088745]|uniref:hypothetical protein n=1 Tax=Streptomyces sp. NPDC088745 TaxID=3365884 RepID=UPI00380B89A3